MNQHATLSDGSITFGSLLMTVSKMVRVIAGFLRNQAKVDAQACAAAFLILDLILSRYNLYGFCFVAVYGLAFSDASRKAREFCLFTRVCALDSSEGCD